MKKKLLKIGKYSVKDAKGFVYNGSYNICVLFTDNVVRWAKGLYDKGVWIRPMSKIEETYREHCSHCKIYGITDDSVYSIPPFVRKTLTFSYNNCKSVVRVRP